MLIKSADDKSKRVSLLDELQQSPLLDARQKAWLQTESRNLQLGVQGEHDAAYYIDANFKDSANIAVLHDLRLVEDNEVAQIDHLLIDRALNFFLLETKCFNGKVEINERGEFSVSYGGERQYGIPSPIEQSLRHERILAKMLARLEITSRVGKVPFHHAVVLHPKATIRRPPTKTFNTDSVIKADQIGTWHAQFVEKKFVGASVLSVVLNLRSSDTLRDIAEQIKYQHRAADLLALPDFMRPNPGGATPSRAPRAADGAPRAALRTEPASRPPETLRRKLECVTCRQKISFAEGKYCWNNEARFGGFQYCRVHQV